MPFCLRFSLLLVATAGALVPARERRDWRQEWEGEIQHRWLNWSEWKKLTWRNQMKLLRRSLGAFADAFWLRQQATADFDFLLDVRYGLRMIGKHLGFSAVAVLILALGIGANTAIFSIVNAVLLKPLPFREPDRLVMIWEHNYKRDRKRNVVGSANFVRWRERARSFDQMTGFTAFPLNVAGEGDPERISVGIVTAEFFETLGVSAVMGRTLQPDDGREGQDHVVVLGQALWQSRFGGSPDAVGKTLRVNGTPHTVVGVMPSGFDVPPGARMWVPIVIREEHRTARGRWMTVAARLKPGTTREQAQAEMSAIARETEKELPDFDAGWGANVFPLHEDLVGEVKLLLWVLLGAVSTVLLIACANVANLLLTRGAAREKEIAIRAALGAARSRIVRQLLTESLLLGLIGGALGLAVAKVALQGLLAIVPTEIPSFIAIGVDFRVLAYTISVSLLTGLLFGVVPAIQSSRWDLQQPLKEGGRSSTGGGRHLLRQFLAVSEIALALVLAASAGLLIRSFARLTEVDPGFNPKNLLSLQVSLAGERARRPAPFFEEAVSRFASVPGVAAAGAISWAPLSGLGSATMFTVNDRPDPPPGEEPTADVRIVEGDLFKAMGIPLLRGRSFDARDAETAAKVVVINDTLAGTFWPNEDPVGKQIKMSWGERIQAEVIGVVGDVRYASLDTAPRATLYWSLKQLPNNFMALMVRTEGRPTDLAPALRAQIAAIVSDLPVANVQTMEDVTSTSLKRPRFTTVLMGIFAAVALVLASIGVYGVMSYVVSQRTHEIGVRMALGARAADVLRMVLAQALPVISIGLAVGLLGAFLASRLLERLLFNLPASDPVTFASIALLLLAVAFFACYLPARRAARVDPMVALHYE